MNCHSEKNILNVFKLLNEHDIKYILLRNTNDELPNNLPLKKDIDLLLKFSNRSVLKNMFKTNNAKQILHPERFMHKLYGIYPFEKYITTTNILIDINYQVCTKSLTPNHIIPLDKEIQDNIWDNSTSKTIGSVAVPFPGPDEYFCILLTRQIFEKNSFDSWVINELEKTMLEINQSRVLSMLNKIFFGFTNKLMRLIKDGKYHGIKDKYLTFCEY